MGATRLPPSYDRSAARLEIDLAHGEFSPSRTVLRARLWKLGGARRRGEVVWKRQIEIATGASSTERKRIESLAEELSSTLGLVLEVREVRDYWIRWPMARAGDSRPDGSALSTGCQVHSPSV